MKQSFHRSILNRSVWFASVNISVELNEHPKLLVYEFLKGFKVAWGRLWPQVYRSSVKNPLDLKILLDSRIRRERKSRPAKTEGLKTINTLEITAGSWMRFEHSHDAFSVITSTSDEQSFRPWMSPCHSWKTIMPVQSAKSTNTLVGNGARYNEKSWITPANHVSAIDRSQTEWFVSSIVLQSVGTEPKSIPVSHVTAFGKTFQGFGISRWLLRDESGYLELVNWKMNERWRRTLIRNEQLHFGRRKLKHSYCLDRHRDWDRCYRLREGSFSLVTSYICYCSWGSCWAKHTFVSWKIV